MKHKVSELEGPLLDAAVAKAEGLLVERRVFRPSASYPRVEALRIVWADGKGHGPVEAYSKDWQDGGPIIERERMKLAFSADDAGLWLACMPLEPATFGPTPLVAAMRCYAASVFGETVELP